MSKQLFGYTDPPEFHTQPYVRFIAVTQEENGGLIFAIRNGAGEYNSIMLSPNDARALAESITEAT
jgi:hypothetical protein